MTRFKSDNVFHCPSLPIDDFTIILHGLKAGLTIATALRSNQAAAPLEQKQRHARMTVLAGLWDSGCRSSMDEGLFADSVKRNLALAQRLRKQLA